MRRRRLIQQLFCRMLFFRQQRVVVAEPDEKTARRHAVFLLKFRQRLRNIFKTPAAGKGDEPHAVGELHDMAVRIDKRRQQRAALKIHDPGIRAGEGTHVGKAADAADDAVLLPQAPRVRREKSS